MTIAPSREAAAHIIMFKHTAPQVESWAPIMRAKFYKNLIDGGQTVDAIATQYGIRASAMTDDLRMLTMYQLACSLDLPVDVLTLVRNPRTFPMTNLDRVYVVPRVSAFLGIRFGENKQPVGVVASDEFKKGYAKIVTDIATGAADSRLLNKAVDFDKYLKSFGDRTPDLSKKGNFTVESLLDSSNAADVKMRTAKLPTRKLVKKRGSVALIPKNIRCYLESRRINDIFVELRKLPVETYQNAVSFLLRSLLEMCVENYLTKSGKMKILLAEDKAAQHGKDWSPTLRQMLNYILTKDNDYNVNPLARKVISKLVSSTDSILSADSLDFFVHNRFACPTESELRSLWEKLEELFKVVLVEPNAV